MHLKVKIVIAILSLILSNLEINAQHNIAKMTDNAHQLFKSQKYREATRSFANVLIENERLHSIYSEDTLGIQELFEVYNEYAECQKLLGDYKNAKDLYFNLYNITYKINRQKLWDVYRIGLADCYLYTGEYEAAEELIHSIQTDDHLNKKAIYLSNLQFRVGKLLEAKSILDNMLIKLPTTSPEYPTVMQNRGYICWQIDTLQENAYRDLSTALQLISNKSDNYYWTMSNLAILQAKRGNIDDAVNKIDSCVDYFKEKSKSRLLVDYIIVQRKRAEILYFANDYPKAMEYFKHFYECEKLFVLDNFMTMSEQQRLDFWKKEKPFISEIFQLEKHNPDFLYDVALFRRQVALLGGKDSMDIKQKLSISKEQITKNLKKNNVAIEFIKYEKDSKYRYAALLLSGNSKRKVEFIPLWAEDSIKSFSIAGNRLDSALCSNSVADKNYVYQNDSLSSYIWNKLLPYIPERSTVYFAPDGILHLLAIEYLPSVNNGKYEMHRLTTTGLLAEPNVTLKKEPKTGSLIIGGLNYDQVTVAEQKSQTPNHDAYDYLINNKQRMLFSYLPGSKIESDSIRTRLSNAYIVNDCDEAILKERIGAYRNVHLSTHGYSVNVDVPYIPYAFRDSITEDKSLLASGIALSGANVSHRDLSREDGLLSARELCEMDLTGVDLVVASCCQSAQGRVSDEGPIGIVRGLKKSGVKSIIASLWPVDDGATTLLMQYFYDFWCEGKGKDGRGCTKTKALRMAQERLKQFRHDTYQVRVFNSSKKRGEYKTVKSDYSAPYYWAPFIIIDDI